ncbi:ion channel [Lutimonas sp.]|uniref:ion channel n=1 Tax=Lutimonas sp. TaxID=1872403 RepID=UPI003D9B7E50
MFLTILVGLVVIGITVVIQGYGTIYWVRRFDHKRDLQPKTYLRKNGLKLLITTSIFLIFIHLFQAAIWALVYMLLPGVTEFETFEKSMYFSLVTFTTLGYGEITISSANRILAGLEAINGITLIGWSTAFMFAIFQELMKEGKKEMKGK